ncbi:MAG: glycerol-3-phosphate responsive antiterminator [Lentisphaerae bacterium]|jgi:glycerol uptake operon antiterminator|nr:glycerol-3-phosphate responsive antiterminator [Lentisphaerota bacterium]
MTVQSNYIIAALRTPAKILQALTSPVQTVFLLAGNICDLPGQCQQLKDAGKMVFIHLDMLNGLKGDASGLKFLQKFCGPNGVISTKAQVLKLAREQGLFTILRVFGLDSQAMRTGREHVLLAKPDFVEVLPGVASKVIAMAKQDYKVPIIAGGLIETREDVNQAFAAGANAVSTSNHVLWQQAPESAT